MFQYPLNFLFKITSVSNDFTATDASGKTIFFVKEDLFKFGNQVKVYSDESKKEVLYDLVSDKIIDFQQDFTISNIQKKSLVGKVRKQTIQSVIKAIYHLQDSKGNHTYTIKKRKPSMRFLDYIFDELIPGIDIFSGYIFNSKYVVTDLNGKELIEIRKKPSFWERKFQIIKLTNETFNEELVILSIVLMIIQQRDKS